MVYIGSARSDERGKAHGGAAGDQKKGGEVSRQAWYAHSKGWRVLRARDSAKAATLARIMSWACGCDLIGYDQYQRNTLYDALAEAGFGGEPALSKAVETDCSALVRVCLAFAGVDVPEAFNTANMASLLLATGEFVELEGAKYALQPDYLGAGDILVTKSKGHTAVVLNHGGLYEPVCAPEKVFGADILRRGDAGAAVKLLQEYLIALGYDLGSRGADGDFGSRTESALKAFQLDSDIESDGEFGAQSRAALMAAIDALSDAPAAPEPAQNLTVRSGSWHIRTGPGTDFAAMGYVSGGEVLAAVDAAGWSPVLYGGELGFISDKALKEG